AVRPYRRNGFTRDESDTLFRGAVLKTKNQEPRTMTNYTLGGYAEIAAPADLRPYVDCLWTYALPAAAAQPATAHRVLQETGVSLCFVGGSEEPRLIFHGPVRTPRIYRPPAGVEVAAVRLKPEGSRELLGL